jgi:hypothetical protein
MGNWTIVIKGVGCHHNMDYKADADRMAAEFVKQLRVAGHNVTHAAITYGGETDLSQPAVYLDGRTTVKGPRCDKEIIHGGNEHRCGLVEAHEGVCLPVVKWERV